MAPNHPQAKTFLAIVRIEMGMSAVAVKLLTEALELDPTLVEALIYRGVANMQTGEAQAALDDWAEATKIRPDSAAVLQPLIERAEGMLDGSIKPPQPTVIRRRAGLTKRAPTHGGEASSSGCRCAGSAWAACASPSTSLTARRRAQAPSSLSLRDSRGHGGSAGGGQAADRGHIPGRGHPHQRRHDDGRDPPTSHRCDGARRR